LYHANLFFKLCVFGQPDLAILTTLNHKLFIFQKTGNMSVAKVVIIMMARLLQATVFHGIYATTYYPIPDFTSFPLTSYFY
jgi:hypothetical protein